MERLESYQRESPGLFRRVIATIESDIVPALKRHAITGLARITTENPVFADPLGIPMLVDVLNERGYRTCATVEMREVATHVDPATHAVVCAQKPRYKFEVMFEGSRIRRGT